MFVIAEVGCQHDGSLGTAHAYIDAIADTGAHAVKFQTHIAEAESSLDEPWRTKFSVQDATRYDYWKRMEFTAEQWAGLRQHAHDRRLKFLSSPFSIEAVGMLKHVGVDMWKVASGEITNLPMLSAMMDGRPIFLSTGMSPLEEIDTAVLHIKSRVCPTVMQCTSAYPCGPEHWGLNMLEVYRDSYDSPVGLSDHSGAIAAGLAAAALGADALEVHVTLSPYAFGPDVKSSVGVSELSQLVKGADAIATALANPVDKDEAAVDLAPVRDVFMKSLAVRETVFEGGEIRDADLVLRKPGTGIPPSKRVDVVGRHARHTLKAGRILTEDDLA